MNTSALILAGGESRRMGQDKAALRLGGHTLLARTTAVLGDMTDEIIVVGRTAAPGLDAGVCQIPDDVVGVGPLGGLFSGLRRIRNPYALVVACDLPFLNPVLLRYLTSIAPGFDAVVPRIEGHPQTMHAVYSRSLCPIIENQLSSDSHSLRLLLSAIRVRWVDEPEINTIDPAHRSFIDVNTPDRWFVIQRTDVAGTGM